MRGLSKIKKRDAETPMPQREPRKAANHLQNSEDGSVRRTDSPKGFTGKGYPILTRTNFKGKR